jgi:uncharacterized membrane protein YpjA
MPALDPRIIHGLGEVSVILQRSVPEHEIVEAFLVSMFSHSHCSFYASIPHTYYEIVIVSVFGVGGAIIWAIKKC